MTITQIDIINVLTTHTTVCSDIIDMITSKVYREPRSFEVGRKYRVQNTQNMPYSQDSNSYSTSSQGSGEGNSEEVK